MGPALLAGLTLAVSTGCATPPADATGSAGAGAPDAAGSRVDRMSWLVGDWRRLGTRKPAGERWWRDGDVLLAESWHTGDDGPVLDERLSIEPAGDGVVYRASIAGREGPPVDFTLVRQGPGVAIFENRAHGHPWRIEYAASDDVLLARVHFAGGLGERDRIHELSFARPR